MRSLPKTNREANRRNNQQQNAKGKKPIVRAALQQGFTKPAQTCYS